MVAPFSEVTDPAGLQRFRVQAIRATAVALTIGNLGLLVVFAVAFDLPRSDLLVLVIAVGVHALAAATVGRRWNPGGWVTIAYLVVITGLVHASIATATAPDTEAFWFLLIPAGLGGLALPGRAVAVLGASVGASYVAVATVGGGHTWQLTTARLGALALLSWSVVSITTRLGEALHRAEAARVDAEQRRIEVEAANARLSELDELKSEFVSTVSHELRTPLTVILGLSATLNARRNDLTPEQEQLLTERIEANARSLDGIIGTLLDVARIERGAMDQRHDRVELAQVTHAVVERLELLLRDHPVALDLDGHAAVHGDERLLDRVIENLLTNAARHTPPGTPVRVRVHRRDDDVHLAVSDDGPGIPPASLERLGERFYRAGDAEGRASAGVGVGLALVSEVLQAHGAKLDVVSEVGRGTTFSFVLPRAAVAAPSGDRASAPPDA